jgi:tyrosyl-tRNA synthetase
MNIPLVPPPAAGEYNRLVTRTESPELVNSTAPAVAGEANVDRIMSSNARDSRGPSTNDACGLTPGHAPRKHRYTALTDTEPVYEVLNTRTSEKNGLAADPTGNDVTAGNVTVSAKSGGARRSTSAVAGMIRRSRLEFVFIMVTTRRKSTAGGHRAPVLNGALSRGRAGLVLFCADVTSPSAELEQLRRGAVDLIEESDLARRIGNKRLTVKVGFDPSAPDIHLGHTVVLRKMRHFQDAGHRVVFVVGDFTAMIGDPSGRKSTRPQLSRAEIEANAATYTRQAFRILDRDKTVVEFNSSWLSPLGAEGFVKLAGRITVARILERDDFQKRWAARHPIALHELLYPLAQGYDSVALKADVELGGTDQLFNLLLGRDLMREEGLEPQIVLTLPLLVGLDGTEKMSKSLGNAIGIEEPPSEIYGKLMSLPDRLMWSYFELLTDLPPAEIAARRRTVEEGGNPRDVKAELARRITADFHGPEAAERVEADFQRAFSKGEVPEEIETRDIAAAEDGTAARALVAAGLCTSMREARRKIAEGALRVYPDAGAPREVRDPEERLAGTDPTVVRLGRKFVRITWKD